MLLLRWRGVDEVEGSIMPVLEAEGSVMWLYVVTCLRWRGVDKVESFMKPMFNVLHVPFTSKALSVVIIQQVLSTYWIQYLYTITYQGKTCHCSQVLSGVVMSGICLTLYSLHHLHFI